MRIAMMTNNYKPFVGAGYIIGEPILNLIAGR